MSIDLTQSPYYDTSEAEKKKGYVRVLPIPGRVVQSRELSVLQSLTQLQIKDIADTLFKDGAVIEGCQICVRDKTVLVSSGKIYFRGYVLPVAEKTLEISGEGIETIGIDIFEEIVTENEDASLRDPALGFTNYGQPGMHRLKLTTQVVKKDDPTIKLCQIKDGAIYFDNTPPPEFWKIIEILARRTYDESGNYVVQGLNVEWTGQEDAEHLYPVLTSGKAYIEGFEVTIPGNVHFAVDKPLDTEYIYDEPFTYQSEVTKYFLRDQPVAQVESVEGIVRITNYVTRGPDPGGVDDLRPYQPRTPIDQINSPVVEIISITGYQKGIDWIQNGNFVDWSPNGNEPSPGSTYQVTWTYKKRMVPEDKYPGYGDYEVLTDEETGNTYIAFMEDGDKPVENSTFEVTYQFYLSRHDMVYLNKEGQIIISKGTPNRPAYARPNLIHDNRILPLALLIISPRTDLPVVVADAAIRRVTMERLNKIIKQIENIEFNQAIDDLDKEAMVGEQATLLRGILTDGFLGYSKIDLHHPLFENSGCALDFDTQTITNLQLLQQTKPTINQSLSTVRIHPNLITLPYTTKLLVEQPYATNYLNINAYNFFNAGAQLVLTPAIDNWVERVQVVTGVRSNNINVGVMRRWWSPHMSKDWYRTLALKDRETLRALGIDVDSISPNTGRGTFTYASRGALILDKVREELIPYARANTIQLYGYNFTPYADNLTLKCYNTIISAYPENQTYQGTKLGTLRSDSKGIVKGYFVLPGDTFKCGQLPITLYNSNNKAIAYYTAKGTRTVEEYTLFNGTVTVTWTDPVAQSFGFTEDTVVTKIGLFFKSKDTSLPVIVEVKNVVNGYPGNIVYARKELYPENILVSDDGTLETTVVFDEPIYCKKDTQYCIALRTDSNLYHIWYAVLGNQDVKTKAYVTSNPYGIGTLFTSSNNETWVASPTADLKMKIYGATFTPMAILEFQPVQSSLSTLYSGNVTYRGFNRICLLADAVTPEGTKIDWYYGYEKDGQTVWQPIYPYDDIELTELIDNVRIRAVFHGTSNATPFLNINTVVFVGFLTVEECYYVTRNVVTTTPFNKVKQILEVKVPTGCSFHVDYAVDGTGTTWKHSGTTRTPVSVENIGDGFYRYTFVDTLSTSEKNFRGLIKLKTNHPTNRVIARRFMNILTEE